MYSDSSEAGGSGIAHVEDSSPGTDLIRDTRLRSAGGVHNTSSLNAGLGYSDNEETHSEYVGSDTDESPFKASLLGWMKRSVGFSHGRFPGLISKIHLVLWVILMLIGHAFGTSLGKDPVYRPFQSIPCFGNKVLPVTDPGEISRGSFYLIASIEPQEKFTCSSEYIQDNWNCSFTVGNVNRSQCDGFQLAENDSTVHLHCGSVKTSRVSCIYQKAPPPHGFKVFPVYIYIKDQDSTIGTDLAEPSSIEDTKLNGWMLAFCICAILLAIGFMICKRDQIKSAFTGLKGKIQTQWSRVPRECQPVP